MWNLYSHFTKKVNSKRKFEDWYFYFASFYSEFFPFTTNHVRGLFGLFPPLFLPVIVARARSDSLMHGFLCGNTSLHYSTLLRARSTLYPFRTLDHRCTFVTRMGRDHHRRHLLRRLLYRRLVSRYKIYRPSIRNLSTFLLIDQSPTIDSWISKGYNVGEKSG